MHKGDTNACTNPDADRQEPHISPQGPPARQLHTAASLTRACTERLTTRLMTSLV